MESVFCILANSFLSLFHGREQEKEKKEKISAEEYLERKRPANRQMQRKQENKNKKLLYYAFVRENSLYF